MARSLRPSALRRNISLTQRIGTLSAGIGSPSLAGRGSLCGSTSDRAPPPPRGGGRLQIGIGGRLGSERVADFKSESVAGFKSEWVADFRRNPHPGKRLSSKAAILSSLTRNSA